MAIELLFFDGWHLQEMMQNGNIGWLMLIWGVLMIVVVSPVLTYFLARDGIAAGSADVGTC